MKTIEKQKICAFCEGRIPLDSLTCPFCATEQPHVQAKGDHSTKDYSNSLYQPMYSSHKGPEESSDLSASLYPQFTGAHKAAVAGEESAKKSSLWPTVLLISGANFLLWGFLQLFFSEQGRLQLEFATDYWFLFVVAALPMLFYGVKLLKELD